MVEALCGWAMRKKVHIDPSAPAILGQNTGVDVQAQGQGQGTDGSGAPSSHGVALWLDTEELNEHGVETQCYGDPPMIMSVRGKASLSGKLQLIATLVRFGFSVDTRSPEDSWTPLHAAVEHGHPELVTALLKLGARLSTDRYLGFTPLHLASQTGHWQFIPQLVEAMGRQYSGVAAWGPSPQYVTLNLVDAYGRTALDIALFQYFANAIPCAADNSGKIQDPSVQYGKAVSRLRELIEENPAEDASIVCGWELLHVLRFLHELPLQKFWAIDWENPHTPLAKGPEVILQAIRALVCAGAKTKWFLQMVEGEDLSALVQSCNCGLGRYRSPSNGYSLIDTDDMPEVSTEAAAHGSSIQAI